jgi:glycosyltransferase involved in cell wall biosynthesis
MKVLFSAYACEPHRGSEPGVGWNIAKAMSQSHEVWVFTSATHKDAIEKELSLQPIDNLNFVYFDPLGWVYDWSQESKRPHWDVHLHYYLWQLWAYFVGRSLHRTVDFDVAHHVTYVKYSSPSFLALLPIPFFWGPVGGAESAPDSFWVDFNFRGKVYETVRAIVRLLGELDPFVRLTARRSAWTWATTHDTLNRVHKLGAKKATVLSESGLSIQEIDTLSQLPTESTTLIRFISMGRLLHWKGFHLGLQAFIKADIPDAEYWILGEGPEREQLLELANASPQADRVKFLGRLPREMALAQLGQCHILVHPSLHDSGGWVCLEAMAAGRPVICLDLGGSAVQVTANTGYKIPAIDPEQTIRDLALAMTDLAQHEEKRISMGLAGKQLVKNSYSWNAKANFYSEFYDKVIKL